MIFSTPFLPPELILHIINLLLPSSSEPIPIALPANHPITKTLLSFTLTSHLPTSLATHHLYSISIYIDTFHRLNLLQRSLTTNPSLRKNITSIYLSPFQSTRITSLSQITPITAFLTPLSRTTKRLILNIPLRNIQTPSVTSVLSERQISRLLYSCLEPFRFLEVFCSVADDLDLLKIGGEWICTHWPRLRILGLYNSALEFLEFELPKLSLRLERIVLARPDGLGDSSEEQFLRALKDGGGPIDVVAVDAEGVGRRVRNERRQGEAGEWLRRLDIELPELWIQSGTGGVGGGFALLASQSVKPLFQRLFTEKFLEGSEFAV